MWVTVLNLVKLEELFERLKKRTSLHLSNGPCINLTVAEKIEEKNSSVFLIDKKTLIDREKQELIRNELNLIINVKYCSIKADLIVLNFR